jgi:RHS repeat-associated protein
MDASAKLSYFLYNGHGDVVQTVSESGEVENQYDYDVFGNATLTVESEYSSAIRYAGEFFDAEVGLYYLRARYYNPYTGRFISEDSYWGEDANPLSLNRYTYAHNSPLMFWDPTGHWAEGDEELNVEAQAKIIALTNAYYYASSDGERTAIEEHAKAIRKDENSKIAVVTPLQFNESAIVEINQQADASRGYMTKEEWDQALTAVGITTASEDKSSNWAATTTTTTIGRTNLTVNSSYMVTLNEDQESYTETANSSINLSYNVTQNEARFLMEIKNSNVSVEQALVVWDTLQSSGGKITKDQLEHIGIPYRDGFLWMPDNIDTIEASFKINNRGMSVTEAEILFQKEEMGGKIQKAFGVLSLGSAGGGFRVNSSHPSDVVTVKIDTSKGTGKLDRPVAGDSKGVDFSGAKGSGDFSNIDKNLAITTATTEHKGGETVVAHSLRKHASDGKDRNPDIWGGKVKGNSASVNAQAEQHLREILDGPGEFVQNGKFLEKKLPDGRGVRLNQDGTFKGFIDR